MIPLLFKLRCKESKNLRQRVAEVFKKTIIFIGIRLLDLSKSLYACMPCNAFLSKRHQTGSLPVPRFRVHLSGCLLLNFEKFRPNYFQYLFCKYSIIIRTCWSFVNGAIVSGLKKTDGSIMQKRSGLFNIGI